MEPQPIQEQPAKVEAVPPEISRAIGIGLTQRFAKEIKSIQDGIMVLDLPTRNPDVVTQQQVQVVRHGIDNFAAFLSRLSRQPVQLKQSTNYWIFEFLPEGPSTKPLQPGEITVDPELTRKLGFALGDGLNNALAPVATYSELLSIDPKADIVRRTFGLSIHTTAMNIAHALGEIRNAATLTIHVDAEGNVTLTPNFLASEQRETQPQR